MATTATKRMKTFGMDLPVIADLGDGWALVAHPNGPAIATEHSLATLSIPSKQEPCRRCDVCDEDCGIDIPERVRAEAVEEFKKIAWTSVKHKFGYTD